MKYLKNNLENTLVIGYLEIPAGAYGDITDKEAESTDVIYAIRSKWATLHDTPPGNTPVVKEEIVFETPAIQGFAEFPKDEVEAPKAEEEAPKAEEEAPKKRTPKAKAE